MAKFHFSRKIGKRGGSGGMKASATAASAYYRREKRKSQRDGEVYDYSMKKELLWKNIVLSDDAPEWAKNLKAGDKSGTGQAMSEHLWNMVEMKENRKDSQVYIRDILAIPIELNRDAGIELVKKYAQEVIAVDGNFCDVAVHWSKGNPHAHIMMPAFRKLTDDGLSKKERLSRRELRGRLVLHRDLWADHCNESLERNGFNVRVDPRSYKEQGIDLIPTKHQGRHISGSMNTIDNEYIRNKNLSRISMNPEILARKVSGSYVGFIREDVERELKRYTLSNADRIDQLSRELFAKMQFKKSVFTRRELRAELRSKAEGLSVQDQKRIVDSVLMSDQIIRLGVGDDGREHFTTRNAYKTESEMLSEAKKLQDRMSNTISDRALERVFSKYDLNPEQKRAVKYITQGSDIVMVRGMAGTGKTYLLKAAQDLWKEDGRRVWGVTVAGKAARGLEEGSGIKSFTMDSFLLLVGNGKVKFQKGDVIVVDEVGMMTLDRMATLVKIASISGMKLVGIGDPEQAQPIGRGAPAKALMEQCGAVTLHEIIRQRPDWMKDATFAFETGETGAGLDFYNAKGMVKMKQDGAAVIGEMMSDWKLRLQEQGWNIKDTMMAAYTNKTVDQLNLEARRVLVGDGKLPEGQVVRTVYGDIRVGTGERIQFRRNSRAIGVMNGDIGTVQGIEGSILRVLLDNGKQVQADTLKYRDFNYGYASTVHKLQGHTTYHCLFYADSKGIDRHVFLVGASRHRDGLMIYADKKIFSTYAELKRVVSRQAINDNVVDYPVSFSVRRGSDRDYAGKQGLIAGTGIRHPVNDIFRWLFNYQETIESNGSLPDTQARELAKMAADFCDRRWDIYEESKQLREKRAGLEKVLVSQHSESEMIQNGIVPRDRVDAFIAGNNEVRKAIKQIDTYYSRIYKEKLDNAWRAKSLKEHYNDIQEILYRNNVNLKDIDDVLDFKERNDEMANVIATYRRHGTIPVQTAERIVGNDSRVKLYWTAMSENTGNDYERAAVASELKRVAVKGRLNAMKGMDGEIKSMVLRYADAEAEVTRACAELYAGTRGVIGVRKEKVVELEQNRHEIIKALRSRENLLRTYVPVMELFGSNLFKSNQNRNSLNKIVGHDYSDVLYNNHLSQDESHKRNR